MEFVTYSGYHGWAEPFIEKLQNVCFIPLLAMVDLGLLISEGATNKLVYRMRKVS